jgi:hypothetical protein
MKSIVSLGGLLSLGVCIAAITPAANAAVVVDYDIPNYVHVTSGTVSVFSNDANVTATVLSRSGSITDRADALDSGYFGWTWATTDLDTGKYFTFSVTPNSGQQVALDTLTFAWFSNTNGPVNVALRWSVDGFASNLDSVKGVSQNPVNDNAISFSLASQAAFTSATEFRVYAWGGNGLAGPGDGGGFDGVSGFGGERVTLNGTVSAVPEPHQYAFAAGLGLLAFGVYRRCNRSQKTA